MLLEKILNLQTKKPDTGPRIIQVPKRQAGIFVDHDTALQSSAVYACIRVIAEDIAALPWHVYTRQNNGGRERSALSLTEQILNKRPNAEMSAFSFRETMIAWALTWGNGYAEITRDMAGRIAELYPISPDRVEVKRDENDKIVYEVNNLRGPNSYLDARDVFHLHGLGFDGLIGYSTVSYASRSIGLSISLEEFGAQFFGNGATLGGVLEIPNGLSMSNEGKVNLRETFNKGHQGPQNSHKVEVLDAGITYKDIGVEPNKGQFTESRQNQVEEICRWFRISPHKVAHLLRMTFNNVEQLSIDHVQSALIPWITRLEQEGDYKLFPRGSRQYTKINANALLRGDIESRTQFYKEMWGVGALSVNQILEYEDENPIGPDGDKRFVPLNMTTLDKAGEEDPEPKEPAEPAEMPDELIKDRIQTFLMKEQNRFLSLKDRYTDRNEYVDRVCGHLGSQRVNIAKEITAVFNQLITNADQAQIQEASQIYADWHVEHSRKQAIYLYDDQPVQDINDRADLIAQKIKDSALLYIRGQHAVTNTEHQ